MVVPVSLSALALLMVCTMTSCGGESEQYVLIETEYGNMKAKLFNETPQHRDNFVKLVSEGFYNDLLFHRVINGFMIQGGDPNSKNAAPEAPLGAGGPGYQIPAEIGKYHFKGALAAARQGDNVNPEKKSSGSQFYVVQGSVQSDANIDNIAKMRSLTYSDEDRKRYTTDGGTPQLDGEYTVFGQVVEGLDVIDKIAAVQTGRGDRPVQDIKMQIKLVN
jgi:peptidyl-prolyl cis-trans isomerase B (cyclophilin B)